MGLLLESTLVLGLGSTRNLHVPAHAAIHIGSKAKLHVIDHGSSLTLIATKIGETHLLVGSKSYLIEIVTPSTSGFYQSLTTFLQDHQGLKAVIRDGHVVITGQLLRFEDWQDIADLAQQKAASYQFAARPLSDVADQAFQKFKALALKVGLPQPRLMTEGALVLSLPAGSDNYVSLAEQTFGPYGIGVRVTPSQVKLSPLVRTHVILAELVRDLTRDFGLQFPDSYSAKVLPQFQPPADLVVQLKSLEQKGLSRILASPNLLCRSGSEANFLAGGELPIRTSKYFGGELMWKQYGVILKVKPEADTSGAMSLDLETEVSIIDKANAIEGIPALRTNSVHSHFDLAGRKTIALSGLLREDWDLNRSGLAGLASLPILGALFRSQSFMDHKSELVIFVTPEVVSPDGDSVPVQLPKGWADDDL